MPNASILKRVFKFDAQYREFFECKMAKFEQVETTFNAKRFIRKLSRSISSNFGAIRS